MVTFVFRGPTNIEAENIWKDTSQLDIVKKIHKKKSLLLCQRENLPFYLLCSRLLVLAGRKSQTNKEKQDQSVLDFDPSVK